MKPRILDTRHCNLGPPQEGYFLHTVTEIVREYLGAGRYRMCYKQHFVYSTETRYPTPEAWVYLEKEEAAYRNRQTVFDRDPEFIGPPCLGTAKWLGITPYEDTDQARRIRPGLVTVPEPLLVQPRAMHIHRLPILISLKELVRNLP